MDITRAENIPTKIQLYVKKLKRQATRAETNLSRGYWS
jgi:hypothetical protein